MTHLVKRPKKHAPIDNQRSVALKKAFADAKKRLKKDKLTKEERIEVFRSVMKK